MAISDAAASCRRTARAGTARSRRCGAAMATAAAACRAARSRRRRPAQRRRAPRTPRRAGGRPATAGLSVVPGFWNTIGNDVAEQPPPLARRQVGDVAAIEAQPLRTVTSPGIRHELGDGQGGDRLARARLADDADDLAATDREGRVADRVDVTAGRSGTSPTGRRRRGQGIDLIVDALTGIGHAAAGARPSGPAACAAGPTPGRARRRGG